MLGKIALVVCLILCFPDLTGQEINNRKLGIETGFILTSSDLEGLAILFGFEPKVKIRDRIFAGARFGFAMNSSSYENFDIFQYEIDTKHDNAIISLTPTLEYYPGEFNWKGKYVDPYVGIGVGYHLLYDIEVSRITTAEMVEIDIPNRVGFLLRGGFEIRNFRLGLEYTFIPKADIELPEGQIIGTVDDRYLGFNIGLVIGARKDFE